MRHFAPKVGCERILSFREHRVSFSMSGFADDMPIIAGTRNETTPKRSESVVDKHGSVCGSLCVCSPV